MLLSKVRLYRQDNTKRDFCKHESITNLMTILKIRLSDNLVLSSPQEILNSGK